MINSKALPVNSNEQKPEKVRALVGNLFKVKAQGCAIATIYVVPFLPASFDVWTLEKVAVLVEEARAFNPDLKSICFLNRADPKGSDNTEAAAIASEVPGLVYLDAPLGNRKAFRNASAQGLAVNELKPKDSKAVAEMMRLYQYLFDPDMISKINKS